jgi:DNA-binding XRE family transcriptional regulator
MQDMAPRPKKPRTSEIYRWRVRKGWTQTEMAKEMGIGRTKLHYFEQGEPLPKLYQRAFNDLKAKYP